MKRGVFVSEVKRGVGLYEMKRGVCASDAKRVLCLYEIKEACLLVCRPPSLDYASLHLSIHAFWRKDK